MTQKKIGDILYVFKQEAYEITADTDVTTIYVQQELLDAFKTANSTLASKIKPFNFYVMVVKKQPWGDYINADDPAPEGNQGTQGEQGGQGSTIEVETGEQGAQGEQGTQG